MGKRTIFIVYCISIIILSIISFFYRRFVISKKVKDKYVLLNKRPTIRCVFFTFELIIFVILYYVFKESESIPCLALNMFVAILIDIILIYLIQIYPLNTMIISTNDKLYVFKRRRLMEFSKNEVRFVRDKLETMLYYKEEIVLSTHQLIEINKF